LENPKKLGLGKNNKLTLAYICIKEYICDIFSVFGGKGVKEKKNN